MILYAKMCRFLRFSEFFACCCWFENMTAGISNKKMHLNSVKKHDWSRSSCLHFFYSNGERCRLALGVTQVFFGLEVRLDVGFSDKGVVVGAKEPDALQRLAVCVLLDCRQLHMVGPPYDLARPGWVALHLGPHKVAKLVGGILQVE